MKKTLFLFLLLIGLLCALSVSACAAEIVASGDCGENVTWTLDSEGTLTVKGSGRMNDYDHFEGRATYTPWWLYTFESSKQYIYKIVVEEGVTHIGVGAFDRCWAAETIDFPRDIPSIGTHAFAYCESMTEFRFPDGMTAIPESLLFGCAALKTLDIPNTVTRIGASAFGYCSGLSELEIPASVTAIGEGAFQDCAGLTEFDWPETVTAIPKEAFKGCDQLARVGIPASVTSIGAYAFQGCNALTALPEMPGVESIGSFAFWNCLGLKTAVVPDSVTALQGRAFSGCVELESAVLPAGVTEAAMYLFQECEKLERVTLPLGLKTVSDSAFLGCKALTDVFYRGTQAQWDGVSVVERGNDALLGATMHFADRAGSMTADGGGRVDFSLTDGVLSLSNGSLGAITPETPVFVAVYDSRGRFAGLQICEGPCSVNVGGDKARLFWIRGDSFTPLSECAGISLTD